MLNRIPGDPESWDPHNNHLENNHNVFNLVYSRIINDHYGAPTCQDDPAEGDLAERWNWVDDRTLDVQLREGIRFQGAPPVGNRELVAEDVVHSLKDSYAREDYMRPVADVTRAILAPSKYTVRFQLTVPMADYIKTGPRRYPVEILAPEINTPGKSWTLHDHMGTGTGPFVLKRYLPGVKLEFEKNPNYFRPGLPYLNALSLLIIPDESTTVSLIRAGRVDVARILNAQAVEDLKKTAPRLTVQTCGYHASLMVFWRTDKPPFNDVRVRRALSMAIDQDAYNKTVLLGTGTPRWSPVHSLLGDWAIKLDDVPAEVRQYVQYQPAKAKELLAQAGYADKLDFRLVYNTGSADFRPAAEALSSFWTAIGVKVSLVGLERAAYNSQVVDKVNYEDAALSLFSSATVDEVLYTYFHSGVPRNRSKVSNPELDKLLEAQRTMVDEKARKKLVDEIQVRLIDTQYILVLPLASRSWVLQPYVKNAYFKPVHSASTEFLRFAWLDK